jgi:WhiB family redox-sensing transcriptional regulator
VELAKKVCAGCDVKMECLDYALEKREEYGLWGGLTPRERGVMR